MQWHNEFQSVAVAFSVRKSIPLWTCSTISVSSGSPAHIHASNLHMSLISWTLFRVLQTDTRINWNQSLYQKFVEPGLSQHLIYTNPISDPDHRWDLKWFQHLRPEYFFNNVFCLNLPFTAVFDGSWTWRWLLIWAIVRRRHTALIWIWLRNTG